MCDFRINTTQSLEDMGLKVLHALGYTRFKRNNAGNRKYKTDYIYDSTEKKYVDFQFIQNYSRFHNLTIDFISVYKNVNCNQKEFQEHVLKRLSKDKDYNVYCIVKDILCVTKWGKVFNTEVEDYPDSLLYFIYDEKVKDAAFPHYIFLIETKKIKQYVEIKWMDLFLKNKIRLNDKSRVGDTYGSAFITINLWEIAKNVNKNGILLIDLKKLFKIFPGQLC